jgi:hypothetical protein
MWLLVTLQRDSEVELPFLLICFLVAVFHMILCSDTLDSINRLREFTFPDLETGKVIELPRGAEVLGKEVSRCIYIREEYITALTTWNAGPGYILLGAPGIGKSTFAFMLFCYEMSKGESVLLIKGKKDESPMTLFHQKETDAIGSFHDLADFSKQVVVIYDGQEGFQSMGGERVIFKKVLVVHSPSADVNNSEKALQGRIRMMEPFSLDEAKDCTTKLGSAVTIKQVEDNFALCGGLARLLTWKTADVKRSIDEGCQKLIGMDVGTLCGGVLMSGDEGKLCHRVLHLRRKPGEVGGYYLEFASKYVETKVVDAMAKSSEAQLLKLANEIDINGSLRGGIFENRMHHSFSTFKLLGTSLRLLFDSVDCKAEDVTLEVKDFEQFQKLEDIGPVCFCAISALSFCCLFKASFWCR